MTSSTSRIREAARNALPGNYILFDCALVISGLLTGACDQVLSSFFLPSGKAHFLLIFLLNTVITVLVSILSQMFQAGRDFLSLNIARYNRTAVTDLFLAFRYDTAKAFKLSAVLAVAGSVCSIPMSLSYSYFITYGLLVPGQLENPDFLIRVIFILLAGILGTLVLQIVILFPLSQVLFLYIDHQEYSAIECIRGSIRIMKGQYLRFLKLHLSFLGYYALCVLSLGLGLLWVVPYLSVTRASFYMDITGNYKPY
ncbi:MAG: DUF975 family protein [Lachnospiraceae bacterium]|nr:DUF975 family protein [Lachnospiraceae bacterium]